MLRYVLKRIAIAVVIVWGVLTLTFVMIHLAPGDPSSVYVRPEISKRTLETVRRQMGLDLPLGQQYLRWMRELAVGNLGQSFSQKRPVRDVLWEAIPNTLQLTVTVFVLQLFGGIFFGIFTAVQRGRAPDYSVSSILLFIYSVPGFWLGLMAILVFSLKPGWLPSGQMKSLVTPDGFLPALVDRLRHLILPATVLAAPFAAYTARFVRGSLTEVLNQDYIRTAYAYGLSRRRILYRYALKNALLPLVTLSGLSFPFLLGGAVVTESVFAWPGMGRLTIDALFAHDYPLILASTWIAAISVVLGNLVSDLVYAAVDPRIRIHPQVGLS